MNSELPAEQEEDSTEERRAKGSKVAVPDFVVYGVIALTILVSFLLTAWALGYLSFWVDGVSAPAKIQNVKFRPGIKRKDGTQQGTYVVSYAYVVEGNEFEGRDSVVFEPQEDTLQIEYLSSQPSRSRVASGFLEIGHSLLIAIPVWCVIFPTLGVGTLWLIHRLLNLSRNAD